MENGIIFTERFTALLAQSNKMQIEICKEIGVSKQRLSCWKTGYSYPNYYDLIMLADFFGVTTDYLLGYENEDGSKNTEIVRARKEGLPIPKPQPTRQTKKKRK